MQCTVFILQNLSCLSIEHYVCAHSINMQYRKRKHVVRHQKHQSFIHSIQYNLLWGFPVTHWRIINSIKKSDREGEQQQKINRTTLKYKTKLSLGRRHLHLNPVLLTYSLYMFKYSLVYCLLCIQILFPCV